jgi:hypothetical protein
MFCVTLTHHCKRASLQFNANWYKTKEKLLLYFNIVYFTSMPSGRQVLWVVSNYYTVQTRKITKTHSSVVTYGILSRGKNSSLLKKIKSVPRPTYPLKYGYWVFFLQARGSKLKPLHLFSSYTNLKSSTIYTATIPNKFMARWLSKHRNAFPYKYRNLIRQTV